MLMKLTLIVLKSSCVHEQILLKLLTGFGICLSGSFQEHNPCELCDSDILSCMAHTPTAFLPLREHKIAFKKASKISNF